jgi:hypothetical protein
MTDGDLWAASHWKSLKHNYRRSPHFEEIALWLEPLYLSRTYTHISQLNRCFIEAICNYLGIKTAITNSWDYKLLNGKTERLAHLCLQSGGAEYISGLAAKDYVDEKVFSELGIKLTWFDYLGYLDYPQMWGDFTPGVTILDMLFNCGKDSPRYMRYVA